MSNGRIILVDPCPIIHVGLQSVLRNTEFSVALATDSVLEVVNLLEQNNGDDEKPADIILCDFEMHDGTAFDLQNVASRKKIPLVLFTAWKNPVFIGRMVEAGAMGLINKSVPIQEILSGLRKIQTGKPALKRQDTRRVTGALATARLESHIDFPLTQREFAVLKELAAGQTNKMVAERLDISYETVKEHVQHILVKLGVSDRTQAAVLAVRKGLL